MLGEIVDIVVEVGFHFVVIVNTLSIRAPDYCSDGLLLPPGAWDKTWRT